MKNQTAPPTDTADSTEVLLQGLIAECHAIIRTGILPAAQSGQYKAWHDYIGDITSLMGSAVKLADAVAGSAAPRPNRKFASASQWRRCSRCPRRNDRRTETRDNSAPPISFPRVPAVGQNTRAAA